MSPSPHLTLDFSRTSFVQGNLASEARSALVLSVCHFGAVLRVLVVFVGVEHVDFVVLNSDAIDQ